MATSDQRTLQPLTQEESLALLASVAVGRVVFTFRALPAIRPVNHIVDHGDIIIRSKLSSTISSIVDGLPGAVVAYEADTFDSDNRLGWSVVVTGVARPVSDRAEVARYDRLLHSWVDQAMDSIIRVRPEIITGYRLLARPLPAQSGERG